MPEATQDHREILERFGQRWRESIDHYADWRKEARELFAFRAGWQWSADDELAMRQARRPTTVFNLMQKFLDAVVGLQINNRQTIRYFPRTEGDAGVNELATAAADWTRDRSGAEDEETTAFGDMLLCGLGFIDHILEQSISSEDYIAQEHVDPLRVLIDPQARKRNLTDARYNIYVMPMDEDAFAERFGRETPWEAPDDVRELEIWDGLEVISDQDDYNRNGAVARAANAPRPVARYQYWTLETFYRVTLPEDWAKARGLVAQRDLPEAEWSRLRDTLRDLPARVEKVRLRCWWQAWIAGARVLEVEKLPIHCSSLQAITGRYDRSKGWWYGLGRPLLDPSRWVNKFFSAMLWQISVGAKGGLMAEEGAFVDQKAAELSWSDPSKITMLADGALAEGRVKEKTAGGLPAGMDRLMEFSMRALPESSGINLELLGMTDRQQAGVLEAQRKQSAMAIISWAFDSMRRYYQLSGTILLEMIRLYIADGRLVRIAGDQGQRYAPLLRDQLTGVYDVIVNEAPTSVNQRERTWAVLESVIPFALKAGIRIPPDILTYAPLPEDLSMKWRKSMSPTPEQQQQEKQKLEILVRQEVAKAMKDETQAQLNAAKAAEIREGAPLDHLRTAAEAGRIQAGGA